MLTSIKNILFLLLFSFLFQSCLAKAKDDGIIIGAEQTELYLKQLKGKKIGLLVNQTSVVGDLHLVDFLLQNDINIQKIFAVEHGFRGDIPDGETFENSKDKKTNLPIVSLYGEKKKAIPEDLKNLDMVMFDIQDIGCRFYTFISSMYYMMEACAENNIEFMVLDRPNPNGDYVDGPVLDMQLKSFVGIIPIPIVHGCTVGELAKMINGEKWLTNGVQCNLSVVPVKYYTHSVIYELPIPPSPNLPNQLSVRLYPSLCFFEATNISIGRGTPFPFQVIGYPNNLDGKFSFMPKSIKNKSSKPLHENVFCKGIDLRELKKIPTFTLKYFIEYHQKFENPTEFWKSRRWIDLLSGDSNFYTQMNDGYTEEEIRKTWQKDLISYEIIRKKYLLYPDFE